MSRSMPTLLFTVACPSCGFSSRDPWLLNGHSCEVQNNGGMCEDYPCCGHERGDCNGALYGSDEMIQSDPHLLCDHNTGSCELEEYVEDDESCYCFKQWDECEGACQED